MADEDHDSHSNFSREAALEVVPVDSCPSWLASIATCDPLTCGNACFFLWDKASKNKHPHRNLSPWPTSSTTRSPSSRCRWMAQGRPTQLLRETVCEGETCVFGRVLLLVVEHGRLQLRHLGDLGIERDSCGSFVFAHWHGGFHEQNE